jgi:hypothetical protein
LDIHDAGLMQPAQSAEPIIDTDKNKITLASKIGPITAVVGACTGQKSAAMQPDDDGAVLSVRRRGANGKA